MNLEKVKQLSFWMGLAGYAFPFIFVIVEKKMGLNLTIGELVAVIGGATAILSVYLGADKYHQAKVDTASIASAVTPVIPALTDIAKAVIMKQPNGEAMWNDIQATLSAVSTVENTLKGPGK